MAKRGNTVIRYNDGFHEFMVKGTPGLQIMRESAKEIAKIARRNAPKKTGELKKNIRFRKLRRQTGFRIFSRTPKGSRPRGAFQELGTVNHPPQKWLRPAFDIVRGRADEMVKRGTEADFKKRDKKLAAGKTV